MQSFMSDDALLSRYLEEKEEPKDSCLNHSRVFDRAAMYRQEESYREKFTT